MAENDKRTTGQDLVAKLRKAKRPSPTSKDTVQDLIKNSRKNMREIAKRASFTGTPKIGRVYNFRYFAKWDEELPYWDRNPVVIPIEIYGDGFLGINFHYIDPMNRAILLNRLIDIGGKSRSENQRLRLSYGTLKGVSKVRMFKPCIKRYLRTQFRSKFLEIHQDDWFKVVVMPMAKWVRATPQKVYADSRKAW